MKSLKITIFFLYYIKQIDSTLTWICSVIDNRGFQNVARTSVRYSPSVSCAAFLFLLHFDTTCDLLLNRYMAKLNPFATVHSLKLATQIMISIRWENWNNRFQHFQIQPIKDPEQKNEILTGLFWRSHDHGATNKLSSSITCLWV